MPRQNQLLGELKTRRIMQNEMCEIFNRKHPYDKICPQTFSAIMNGARSETPKGERVIKFVRKYLEETK